MSEWVDNMSLSLKHMWRMLKREVPGIRLINGVFYSAKEIREKGLNEETTGISAEDIDKLTDEETYSLMNLIKRDPKVGGYAKKVYNMIKSGKVYEDVNGELEESMNNLNDVFADLEYSANKYDNNLGIKEGGYIKMHRKDNLKMNRISFRQKTFKESLNLLSSKTRLNEEIHKVSNYILDTTDRVKDFPKNKYGYMAAKNILANAENKALGLYKTLYSVKSAFQTYKEQAVLAIVVHDQQLADLAVDIPSEDTIEEVTQKIRERREMLDSTDTEALEIYDDAMEATVEDLEKSTDSLIYNPEIDGEIQDMVAAGEDAALYAGLNFLSNHAMTLISGTITSIKKLLGPKFSDNTSATNTPIKQPVVSTHAVSKQVLKDITKALEIKMALQIKGMLESSLSYSDNGSVNKRLSELKYLSPSQTDTLKYGEILSVFSEDQKLNLQALNVRETPLAYKYLHEKTVHYFVKRPDLAEVELLNNQYAHSEADDTIVDTGIAGVGTVVKVDIKFKPGFAGDIKNNKTTVIVDLLPRVYESDELLTALAEHSVDFIKLTNEEKSWFDSFKSLVKAGPKVMVDKDDKGANNKQKKVVNKLYADLNKIKNINKPLFHVILDLNDYMALKDNHKLDLFDANDYKKLVSALPIISITIVDQEKNHIYVSEGTEKMFFKRDLKEYINSSKELQREIQSQFRQMHGM